MAHVALPGLGQAQRPAPKAPGLPADPANVHKAAQDFEAMVIGQFLQPMFDTVDTSHSKFGGGAGEAAWKPMMVQEMGKQIAAHGGLGLSGAVQAAMMQMQEAKSRHAE
jgi:Rod binding domain-containing protein